MQEGPSVLTNVTVRPWALPIVTSSSRLDAISPDIHYRSLPARSRVAQAKGFLSNPIIGQRTIVQINISETQFLSTSMSLSRPTDFLLRLVVFPFTITSRFSSLSQKPIMPPAVNNHNPHPDFKKVEASREDFDRNAKFHITKTINPSWKFGEGANDTHTEGKHISIDPYEPGRSANFNYKLLISSIIPRPIAFLSTRSASGETNLAPFSYFGLVNHDPPLFAVSFVCSVKSAKDSLRNLVESKECVINIISEGFVEAANSCSVNAPAGASEWAVSGLTPVMDCVDVKCARAKEAVFAVEGKLESVREFESKTTPGKISSVLAVIEGTRFWVREDAINAEKNIVDPAVLRPMSRLGGIMYGRTTEAFEITRPDFEKDIGGREGYEALAKAADEKNKSS
ncbi:hypothetical protein jhhlp_002041 [Lomentospora prolificans]|uniref:Flavin reductase like domain-containing protein n=1 Tax=Lomentospora prolificans TaxID=41688 RepID=A0A2N3NCX4_9PEZI|nr:hypothetical protein jhhlp_002041 [Lomentospora prolificans]